jgi:hypothetical protein
MTRAFSSTRSGRFIPSSAVPTPGVERAMDGALRIGVDVPTAASKFRASRPCRMEAEVMT